jgi:SAM-dependent methyltransferase
MNHADHVALLRDGVLDQAGNPAGLTWADLGSGSGAFTMALAELLGPRGVIYSVDKDGRVLDAQKGELDRRFGGAAPQMCYLVADYTRPLDLPLLDGVVMANTLHFYRDPAPVVRAVMKYVRRGGQMIVVEYGVDRGNVWVPHPFSYAVWKEIATRCGLIGVRLLHTVPSRFLDHIYASAASIPLTEPP